jgi:hypothetical protein
VAAREIIAAGPFGWAIWWTNGDTFVEADLIESIDNYCVNSDCNSAPTGDLVVHAKEIIGGSVAISIGGSNSTAAAWVVAPIIKGLSFYSLTVVGANRAYVTAQKMFGGISIGSTATLAYVTANKLSAIANSGVEASLFQCSAAKVEAFIEIDHWDSLTFTGDMIKVTAGKVHIKGMHFKSGANAKGLEITGGIVTLDGCTIDTSANSSTDPVTKSGGQLFFEGGRSKLIAHSTRQSIAASTAQDVIQITPYATNRAKSGNVTLRVVTTELVDATYVS